MILSFETALRTVFSVYAVFWTVVLVVLFLGVGFLMKRAERKQQHH